MDFASWPRAASLNHVVLFPFMSKGHTIPILDLARLLLRRSDTAVTIFTTTGNQSFIATSLHGTSASIITLPFRHEIPDIPPNTESTDQLTSMSHFPAFAVATRLMQPHFEAELEKILPVSFIVSDGFLWWTGESAERLGVRRYSFSGMGNFAGAIYKAAAVECGFFFDRPQKEEDGGGEAVVVVPSFPWIKLRRSDVIFPRPDEDNVHFDFCMKAIESTTKSHGQLANSFEELEQPFLDYLNRDPKPLTLCIGPLCLAGAPEPSWGISEKPSWVDWLEQKVDQGTPVLYVAFGSQADISARQLKEIATGLEKSGTHFLWVLKLKDADLGDGFEKRVQGRGLVVKGWVDQFWILKHPSVQGFLSHCGWNSVMESICSGVPILAWPMMAEQPVNAKLVAEELRIGVRVEGGDDELVSSEVVEASVRELMAGEQRKVMKEKVDALAKLAYKAVGEGGSSWSTLNSMLASMTDN